MSVLTKRLSCVAASPTIAGTIRDATRNTPAWRGHSGQSRKPSA